MKTKIILSFLFIAAFSFCCSSAFETHILKPEKKANVKSLVIDFSVAVDLTTDNSNTAEHKVKSAFPDPQKGKKKKKKKKPKKKKKKKKKPAHKKKK